MFDNFDDKAVVFLGQWRIYNLYLIYDKYDGTCCFYTSSGRNKYWINNENVISIIKDTCLDVIEKAALDFSKNYDCIIHAGIYKNCEYWVLLNSVNENKKEKVPDFISFDCKKFRIIEDDKEKDFLLSYFETDSYRSN